MRGDDLHVQVAAEKPAPEPGGQRGVVGADTEAREEAADVADIPRQQLAGVGLGFRIDGPGGKSITVGSPCQ